MLRVLKLHYQVASSHLPAPQILRVLKLHYQVASSHLPAPQILPVLKLCYKVASSHLPAPQILRALRLHYKVASSHRPAPQILCVLKLHYKVASSQLPAPQIAPRTKVVLQSRQCSASSSTHCSAYYRCTGESPVLSFQLHRLLRRTKVALANRQNSSSCSPNRTLACTSRTRHARSPQRVARTGQIALSPAFRALDTHDLRRGLSARRTNRALACISRTRHARSPQRVARGTGKNRSLACISRTRHAQCPQRVARACDKSHSRLRFAHSTRTISAEGCAGTGQIALSPAFRALDTHDLRRGLRAGTGQIALSPAFRALDTHDLRRGLRAFRALDTHGLRRGLRADRANRTLACISRARHARSPQRVARARAKSHSRLHFAHSTRAISAEGCARTGQIALSPAFRALDTRDLRRGLRAHRTNRTLACISRARHARSPQRVARAPDKSHSRLHFAHTTRTISAEGCIFGRRCSSPPSPLRENLQSGEMFFIRTSPAQVFISASPVQVFHTHTLLASLRWASLRWDCTYTCILALGRFLSLHSGTYRRVSVQASVWKRKCRNVSVQVQVLKCQCVSVSVEVSVFKGFSGRTLRKAFGKKLKKNLKACSQPGIQIFSKSLVVFFKPTSQGNLSRAKDRDFQK